MAQVWYASYGSNMAAARFGCYLLGGRPDGATRHYPGARERVAASADQPVTLPGSVYFAWRSPTWGGGTAFLDVAASGTSLGRAYLITESQLADVLAQEMHRDPTADLDFDLLWRERSWRMGPGRYETLHVVGELDQLPVVTFTASWSGNQIPLNAPRLRYVQMMADGLATSHRLGQDAIADYLLARPGLQPAWSRADLLAAMG